MDSAAITTVSRVWQIMIEAIHIETASGKRLAEDAFSGYFRRPNAPT